MPSKTTSKRMTNAELLAELRARPKLVFELVGKSLVASPWFKHRGSSHAKLTHCEHRGKVRVTPNDPRTDEGGDVVVSADEAYPLREPFRESETYDPYGECFNEEAYEEDMAEYRAELARWKPFVAYVYVVTGPARTLYADSLEEVMKSADNVLREEGWLLG